MKRKRFSASGAGLRGPVELWGLWAVGRDRALRPVQGVLVSDLRGAADSRRRSGRAPQVRLGLPNRPRKAAETEPSDGKGASGPGTPVRRVGHAGDGG